MKAIILAGGGGTRLYPLSTPEKPKQFHSLVSDQTLFQDTLDRLSFLEPEDIFVATNASYVHYIENQAPKIPKENIIVEPSMQNTAPCLGLAAAIIEKRLGKNDTTDDTINRTGKNDTDGNLPNTRKSATGTDNPSGTSETTASPDNLSGTDTTATDEVMAVIYSDHLIKNKDQFEKSLKIAEQIALSESTLNIIEVPALTPNTNLGYVHLGPKWNTIDDTDIYEIQNFTEKPNLEKAKEFVASGTYAWNTGIYVWKASTLLQKFAVHAKDTYEKLKKIQASLDTPEEQQTIAEIYPTFQKISIDYAIMEKMPPKEIRIILSDLGWSDIGTWETLFAELRETGRHEKIEELEKVRESHA